ncbi:MAG: phosphomannomutase/phosphoglucomutase [Rhodocyclaceae bacterium]|nr:phosphomannomutase/phosphoglucomutase [Rhodocyclaceae bacterium]MBV6409911.1 Phosphomannomutase/phosphoglucomutase [Rhodocyclaceae bacterium]MCQ3925231.1 phosphomannomutase/phosphoglucomutase [Rhodocyclaceae bacterium]HNQ57742.1 phosphomannomutase/phosphoglucomutase [Candidatus Desulfobacillus denitrificans]HNT63079.1 phosphomannomutase/phosphoglucomutase [Candidatus Desulfobacillus denitrificans]
MQIPAPEIFKAYDIRGIVGKTLTRASVLSIGRAIGAEARQRKVKTVVVGRDGRLSGPELSRALMEGICASGVDVADIGMVPTPLAYFAAHHLKTGSAVMVTGSHNPPDYNGFKIMLAGDTLHSTAITALRKRIVEGRLAEGTGRIKAVDVRADYLARIVSDVKLSRKMKVVVDCGNGVAGAVAPELFRRMGCELVELYCDVDGNFPNHHPDPSKPDNLKDVIRALRETDAELGLAFDGDGDRLGVVTKDGEIIYPDRQLMLFAADVLTRNPGAQILYDVKCSRNLARSIRHQGGRPLMWMTGHALIKAKLKETGAPLAGEMSGHTFFKERWYGFDDGLYAGARLLEIVSRWKDANWPLKHLPNAVSTPELNLKMREGEPHALVAELQKTAKFEGALEVITLDGLRVEYADGFGLMRASNTTPVLVLRFEADDAAALSRIQADFRRVLRQARPDLLQAF